MKQLLNVKLHFDEKWKYFERTEQASPSTTARLARTFAKSLDNAFCAHRYNYTFLRGKLM